MIGDLLWLVLGIGLGSGGTIVWLIVFGKGEEDE